MSTLCHIKGSKKSGLRHLAIAQFAYSLFYIDLTLRGHFKLWVAQELCLGTHGQRYPTPDKKDPLRGDMLKRMSLPRSRSHHRKCVAGRSEGPSSDFPPSSLVSVVCVCPGKWSLPVPAPSISRVVTLIDSPACRRI